MTHLDDETQTLGDEVGLLQRYFAIERVRFGDALSFETDVAASAGRAQVPVLLLQPIVENATKHGTQVGGRLPIHLTAHTRADRLHVTVRNPTSRSDSSVEGVGLRIIRERLATMFGASASLEIRRDAGEFVTDIEMPFVVRDAQPQPS